MEKSPDAFRTISEVADWLGIQAHVLRFWESKFTQVKPVKRAGGRRYYRPADMMLLGGIKKLLHEDGMTIKGVQKVLREQGIATVSELSQSLDDMAVNAARPRRAQTVVPFHARPSVLETAAKARENAQVELALSGEDDRFDDDFIGDDLIESSPLREAPVLPQTAAPLAGDRPDDATPAAFDAVDDETGEENPAEATPLDAAPRTPDLSDADDDGAPAAPSMPTFRRHPAAPVAPAPMIEGPVVEEETLPGVTADFAEIPDALEDPTETVDAAREEVDEEVADSLDLPDEDDAEAPEIEEPVEETLEAVEEMAVEESAEKNFDAPLDDVTEAPLDDAAVEDEPIGVAPDEDAPDEDAPDEDAPRDETPEADEAPEGETPEDEPLVAADTALEDVDEDAVEDETPATGLRPRVVDAPDPPAEDQIDAAPGLLSLVARLNRLPADQSADIASLAEALHAWKTGQASRHAAQ